MQATAIPGRDRRRAWALSLSLGLFGFGSLTSPVAADCLRAVFFDLGDTLVDQSKAPPWPLFPTALTTIAALQARGRAVGVITNVPAGWDRDDLEPFLQDPSFLDLLDVLVLSSEAPADKPNPVIYTHAHSLLPAPQPPLAATAFVGELLSEIANASSNPTSGARAAGMVGIHFSDTPHSPFADYTIPTTDLAAVLAVVDLTCPLLADAFESGTTVSWDSCAGC